MRGAARIPTYLGRAAIVVGLVLMLIGWNFAAEEDCAQCQFPYLLSASIPGLALVVLGVALEYVQTTRELTARRSREAATLDASLSRLVGFVRDGGALRPVRAPDPDDTIPPPSEHDLSPLDVSGSVFAPPAPVAQVTEDAEPADAEAGGGEEPTEAAEVGASPGVTQVIAGRSSYHKPDCRLVSSRNDMRTLAREEAEEAGLAACRICKP